MPQDDDPDAAAINAKLRDDAAAWSKARTLTGAAPEENFAAREAAKPRPSRAKAKPPEPVPTVKQPFKMSYDGTSDREYAARRVRLGAR